MEKTSNEPTMHKEPNEMFPAFVVVLSTLFACAIATVVALSWVFGG